MIPIISFSHASDNKFTTEEGVEFILHELEPDSGNYDCPSNSLSSMKKRGRPRKDAIRDPENDQNTFNVIESEISEEKLTKKREKKERKERKEREKLRKICFDSSAESTPKKRGRPRKFEMKDSASSAPSSDHLIDYNNSSNTDTLTPPYSEISEESVTGECSMIEMLNLDKELIFPTINHQEEQEQSLGLSDSFDLNFNWSPIQRLMQLNQALAFTNMYKDFIFWDRIIAEFMLPSVTFRLEFGTEKSFDLPFLVVSKLFWIFSQIGLYRIHFLHTGITEMLSEKEEGGVLFNSADAFIYAHLYNDERLMIQHRTNQLIEFDSKSKISKWTIRFLKCQEFWKSAEDKTHMEDFVWGFPKRVLEYLDVALVMNSVLPDPSSWLTWFYTYIHQNGLRNFSVVELSRPPSPFKFPILTEEVIRTSEDNLGNMEFFDNGRDFIFSVLNSTTTENINFDAAVDELLVEQPEIPIPEEPQSIVEAQPETPFEEFFEKETEDSCPLIPVTFTEPVTDVQNHLESGYDCAFSAEEENIFEILEPTLTDKPEPLQEGPEPDLDSIYQSDTNELLIVEISDTDSKADSETDSDSDDFFNSYN